MAQKKNKMRILVLNGPNLNLLGIREPEIYGSETLKDIEEQVNDRSKSLSRDRGISLDVDFRQSNSEADLIGWIGGAIGAFDGIIINPAALTHTSIGVLDAIKATGIPCVEAHVSNIHSREDFRKKCITTSGCIGQVMGFRSTSYLLALEGLVDYILRSRKGK